MKADVTGRRDHFARTFLLPAAMAVLGLAGAACAPVYPPGSAPVPPVVEEGQGAEDVPVPQPVAVPEPEPEAAQVEPLVDVGLRWDADTLTIAPLRTLRLQRESLAGAEALDETEAAIAFYRTSSGAGYDRADGGRFTLERSDTLLVGDPADGQPSLRWNGHTWRGAFKVFVNPRGKLTLVGRLPLEAYLLGVVPGEIGALADDLLEAGRAQAIAARSYTLFYTGRRGKEGFDLYGTVEDQVYGPVESEQPLATRCVETTRSLTALSKGTPIRANYSSTCGGITSDVWESWPATPLPYLASRLDRGENGDWCAASRHHRWVERFTVDEFMRNLRRFAPERGVRIPKGGLGELLDVQASVRSRSGRVWRLHVLTTTGEVTVPGYELRWVLRRAGRPGSILRSNLVKVDVERNRTTKKPIAVVVSGAGNGHGVGLCQTGALGMASAGVRAEDIIEHYFRGVELRALY